jgi:hypothetical protein
MEEGITGDFAFVKAWKGDEEGNLIFRCVASAALLHQHQHQHLQDLILYLHHTLLHRISNRILGARLGTSILSWQRQQNVPLLK